MKNLKKAPIYLVILGICLSGWILMVSFFILIAIIGSEEFSPQQISIAMDVPYNILAQIYNHVEDREERMLYLAALVEELEFDYESYNAEIMDGIFEIPLEEIRGRLIYDEDFQLIYYLFDTTLGNMEIHPMGNVYYYTLATKSNEETGLEVVVKKKHFIKYPYQHYDDFMNDRSYGGDRQHMGNDLMADMEAPLFSVSKGVVSRIGWNQLGGYRVGITSIRKPKQGTLSDDIYVEVYFYYAHMDVYAADIEKGDKVNGGTFIGTVGDSGYGTTGTTGKFPPHLHLQVGIKLDPDQEDFIWIDPYKFLQVVAYSNNKDLKEKAKKKDRDEEYQAVSAEDWDEAYDQHTGKTEREGGKKAYVPSFILNK